MWREANSDAASDGVGGDNPHGAVEQRVGFSLQYSRSSARLAERLERGEPLDRIEEFRAEASEGAFSRFASAAMPAIERHWQKQGDQCEAEHLHEQLHRIDAEQQVGPHVVDVFAKQCRRDAGDQGEERNADRRS